MFFMLAALLGVITYPPMGNTYDIKIQAPPELDVVKVCIERMDPVPVELACVPVVPDEIVVMVVMVPRTTHDDAELRAFAYDFSGNKSEPSLEEGHIDFTPPGRGKMLE